MMIGPDDDNSRERHDRPNDPTQSPRSRGAEDSGHAIPFGDGVYGLGQRPSDRPRAERDEPPPDQRTSHDPRYRGDPGTFGDEPAAEAHEELPPEFDFRRLAAELGFEGHTEGRQCVGFCPICRSADLLRAFATPELRAAWSEFQSELTRALRAAAARYAEADQADPPQRITEIPIE